MNNHFLFLSTSSIPQKSFEAALEGAGLSLESLVYYSPFEGELVLSSSDYPAISSMLLPLREDLQGSLSFLCTHARDPLSIHLLRNALTYFPNQAVFPPDVLMKEMNFGDYSSYPLLASMFSKLDHELMLTAGTYLRCGLDASLSAKELFIHRNTFSYRLNAFIEKTELDIRDYHNALLLELYFQLSSGRAGERN